MGILDAPVVRPLTATRRQPVPCATRAQATGNNQPAPLSDGANTAATFQIQHTALATANSIRFRYANWYNLTGQETDGLNDITVKASLVATLDAAVGIEYFPLYFGGQASVVVPPGGSVLSDPIGIDMAKGQLFYSRTFVSVAAAGQKWPLHIATVVANHEGNNRGAPGADLTGSGTSINAFPTVAELAYGPAQIVGQLTGSATAVIGVLGDSIAAGFGDNDYGFVLRGLNNQFCYQRVAHVSENNAHWLPQSTCKRCVSLLDACTHLIWQMGVNYQQANLQPYSAKIWIRLAARGVPIYATTITPQTTSTDGWVTVVNQTIASGTNEAFRTAYNDWLRGGAPLDPTLKTPVAVGTGGALVIGAAGHPLVGYWEIADLAESARNSGKWKANYTADGSHPTTTGATAMAAGVTTTGFGSVTT